MMISRRFLLAVLLLSMLPGFAACSFFRQPVRDSPPQDVKKSAPSPSDPNDLDGDRVPNAEDNCPEQSNRLQLDRDEDGKGDACDVNLFFALGSYDPLQEATIFRADLLSAQDTGIYLIQYADGFGRQVYDTVLAFPEARFIGYAAQNAYLVYLPGQTLAEVQALKGVRYATDYQPAFKLLPDLYGSLVQGELNNDQPIELTLNLFEQVTEDTQEVEEEVRKLGGEVVQSRYPDLYVRIPQRQVRGVVRMVAVRAVEITLPNILAMDVATTLTEVAQTGFAAPPNGFDLSGQDQVIAIVDTGLDNALSCDSTGTTPSMQNCTVNKIPLHLHPDFSNADNTGNRLLAAISLNDLTNAGKVNDLDGHGTHVIGIALGNGKFSADQGKKPPIRGVAYQAELVFIKVADNDSWPERYTAASMRGAQIHSASFGKNFIFYGIASREVDAYLAAISNIFQVAVKSAGNEGPKTETVGSPGSAKNIITVANSENTKPEAWSAGPPAIPGLYADNSNHLRFTSSTGPTPDSGRIKPDVTAPGTAIASTKSSLTAQAAVPTQPSQADFPYPDANLKAKYEYMSGTSFAAPHVAGMLALIREYLQTKVQPAPWRITNATDPMGPTGDLLKAFLINGAVDMFETGGDFRCRGVVDGVCPDRIAEHIPSPDQGWGRVDLKNSIAPCQIVESGNPVNYLCQFFTASNLNRFYNGYAITNPLTIGVSAELSPPSTASDPPNFRSYRFRFSRAQKVEIALAWYDQPDTFTSGSIINNLDLTLFPPSASTVAVTGTRYYGGAPSFSPAANQPSTGYTHPDGLLDTTNSVEKILLPAPAGDGTFTVPEDGVYTLHVTGRNIEAGSVQKYALVVSGISGTEATDQSGNRRDLYSEGDVVYFKATGLPAKQRVRVYIINNVSSDDFLGKSPIALTDVRGANTFTILTTEADGTIRNTELWNNAMAKSDLTPYNIVIDVNEDGDYTRGVDIVDYTNTQAIPVGHPAGFTVVRSEQASPPSLKSALRLSTTNSEGGSPNKKQKTEANPAENTLSAASFTPNNFLPARTTMNLYLIPYLPNLNLSTVALDDIKVAISPNPISLTTDFQGQFGPVVVWEGYSNDDILDLGKLYNLVLDTNKDGVFEPGIDFTDRIDLSSLETRLPLGKGSTGQAVVALKTLLDAWGGQNLDLTNSTFDQATEAALLSFTGQAQVDSRLFKILTRVASVGFGIQPFREIINREDQLPLMVNVYDDLGCDDITFLENQIFYGFARNATIDGFSCSGNGQAMLNTDSMELRGTLFNGSDCAFHNSASNVRIVGGFRYLFVRDSGSSFRAVMHD